MALNSPGVQVSIIDQSQYLPAAPGSTPLLILATATNKANAAGTGIAPGTLKANAEQLYLLTKQSDVTNIFGSPFFYKTANGTPIHGYELNEYGLLAAYSLLGISSSCYVLRANIDLAQLVGTLVRPSGNPPDGTYWLNTTKTTWGIYEFNQATGSFALQTPLVISDAASITSENKPIQSLGSIGSYAVIPDDLNNRAVPGKQFSTGTFFYKNYQNAWVILGSREWKLSVPLVVSNNSNPTLTPSDTFTITTSAGYTRTITVSSGDGVPAIVTKINALGDADLYARPINGRLAIYYSQAGDNVTVTPSITLANGVGSPLNHLGLITDDTMNTIVLNAPELAYGDSNMMPLWTLGQQNPKPTGSVWLKTSVSGNGMDIYMSEFTTASNQFNNVNVSIYDTLAGAISDLDSLGGNYIPAKTVVGIIGSEQISTVNGMEYFVRKTASVAPSSTASYGFVSEVFGSQINPTITAGHDLYIAVTLPGGGSQLYRLTTSGTSLTSFVNDWLLLQIPNTTIYVAPAGNIYIRHNSGGDIYLSDVVSGVSNGLIIQLGLDVATNTGVFEAANVNVLGNILVSTTTTTGSGTGVHLNINMSLANEYLISGIASAGTGYAVGDRITMSGALLNGSHPANDLTVRVQTIDGSGGVTGISFYSGRPAIHYSTVISGWTPLTYTASLGSPAALPLDGTYWFYSTISHVDIMVNQDGMWKGYRNVGYDTSGHPVHNGTNYTDVNGVIVAAVAPTTQTDGTTPLGYGDLWLDSSDLENYPKLSRWQAVAGTDQWVAIDNNDHIDAKGILFADARWGDNSSITVDPINDPIPTTASLLQSDYVDPDTPDPLMYPQGTLLFNTRLSGYSVKKFVKNYFTQAAFGTGVPLPEYAYTWVTASGNTSGGAAYMGRKAQRHMVVQAMKAAINTSTQIREEDTFFNLIAAPGYPELQPDMVTLNNDRNQTAYIIGDTPLRLSDDATGITHWATNTKGATASGEDGWVTRDTYLGVFYPSGITSDLTGADAVVPASHMMLHTVLNNDTIAYPWFAAAGTRRGIISNATNIGYLDAKTGNFVTIKNRQSIRDVLYTNQINPLAYFTGIGLLNYGNKTSFASSSSLDRMNVARLVAYIRYQLQIAARPFVFEPNDQLTRGQLSGIIQSLFVGLVAQRGLYDYLVVCDASNNTPARIDRNELWVDIAIEPVIAAEFIYIPVRVLATGGIAALK